MRAALLTALLVLPANWESARPGYPWYFPRDHWAHRDYRTEWWYFTGHLGERFAYQFTFFRIGILRERPEGPSSWTATGLVMGHAAVTDLSTNRHWFSEALHREIPLLAGYRDHPDPRIGWSRGPAGTADLWTLDWNGEGFDFAARDSSQRFGFRLTTRPRKPLVFQGPGGFSRKGEGEGAASLYYSFTRLETAGVLELEGERHEVTGESWMDREFSSSQLAEHQTGWDWFSLRLDDGRDLMLYLMRAESGGIDYASGTLVDPLGLAIHLERSAFDVEVLDRWTSPATSARYPSKWRIRAAGLELRVTASVTDQENRSRFPGGVFYWEGAVIVETPDGKPIGRGFVELTGYGAGNRPPV